MSFACSSFNCIKCLWEIYKNSDAAFFVIRWLHLKVKHKKHNKSQWTWRHACCHLGFHWYSVAQSNFKLIFHFNFWVNYQLSFWQNRNTTAFCCAHPQYSDTLGFEPWILSVSYRYVNQLNVTKRCRRQIDGKVGSFIGHDMSTTVVFSLT